MAKKSKSKKIDRKIQNLIKVVRSWRYFNLIIIFLVIAIIAYFSRSLLIAAVVGGRPISRFEVIRELEKQSGQETLDNLISKELILQEAQRRGIRISDEIVQAEIENINTSLQAQGTSLDSELALRGQTRTELQENIRIQKLIEELLKEQVSVSNEEVQTYYEENQAFFGEETSFVDLEGDIREQLRQEKISQEFSKLLQELRNQNDIYYLVEY